MSKSLNPVEKLAREICWLGFTHPSFRIGKTKASYWASLPEPTRERYRLDAAQFVWIVNKINKRVLDGVLRR